MECYNLNRLSLDINLDSNKVGKIFTIVKEFCDKYNYEYNILKNNLLVNQAVINYGEKILIY